MRRLAGAIAVGLALTFAPAALAGERISQEEARRVTRAALEQTAGLIDGRVAVHRCRVQGARARCRAVLKGPRQRLETDVLIVKGAEDYTIRVTRFR